MKLVSINLIGVGEDLKSLVDSGLVQTSQDTNRFSELQSILNESLPSSTPTQASVKVKPTDNEAYRKALRYAAPDLGNEDYYPEKTVNPIVGTASNKTLGTFPLFSSAVLAPAGLWDKRAKAAADYMLMLENAKAKPESFLGEPYQYVPGSKYWENAANQALIDDMDAAAKEGQLIGVPMAGANKPGHPYFKPLESRISETKSFLTEAQKIDEQIDELEKSRLNLNTDIGKRTAASINMWKQLSSLGENEEITIGNNTYYGKKDLVRSGAIRDFAHQTLSELKDDVSLAALAKEKAAELETRTRQESQYTGSADGYKQYLIKSLESKYPIYGEVNPVTGEQEMSPMSHLEEAAFQIAQSRPELFKDIDTETREQITDASKYKQDAPYTLEQLRNTLRTNLGYSYKETPVSLQVKTGEGAINEEKLKAVPQYVETIADKIKRGQSHTTLKTGNSQMIPGKSAATFVIGGKTRVVPYSNTNEMMRAIIEMGGSDNEYGNVDFPSAWANIQKNSPIYEVLSSKTGTKRPTAPPSTASFQEKFNMSLQEIAGQNGFPVVKGINVTGLNSTVSSKDDSRFYMVAKLGGEEGRSSGTIIPKDVIKGEVDETKEWWKLGGDKDVFVPKGGDGDFLVGTYYQKNPSKDGKPATYTIYDKETSSPYKFKGKDGKEFEVTVPEYYVKKITSAPQSALSEALKQYPESEDASKAPETTTFTQKNVATQNAGSGSVLTVPKKGKESGVEGVYIPSDDDLRVAKYILNNSSKFGNVADINSALNLVDQYATATDANTKDYFSKLKKVAGGLKVEDIRKQYK